VTASAPQPHTFSRLHNPARTTPANASPTPSRTPAHDSGPSRIATPFDVENSHLLLHAGLSRRTTAGKTTKFQIAFQPQTGTEFFTILLPANCGTLENTEVKLAGDFAAEIKPEREDVKKLTIIFPTQFQSHLWQPGNQPEATQQRLLFNGSPTKLVGNATVELESGEPLGVWDK
jgi:hypothetical protein